MTTYSPIKTIPAVQIGTRIRLNDDQRNALKAAYAAATATHSAPVSGKSISVATATRSSVDTELCMDRLTFSSLLASRESIALPMILRFQRVLGVKLIDEAELREAFEGYLDYIKQEHGL